MMIIDNLQVITKAAIAAGSAALIQASEAARLHDIVAAVA